MAHPYPMRRIAIGLVLATFLLTLAGSAAAFCGFYVSGADGKLVNNATMVAMMREGTLTVLSMQNNYQGPPEDFALIVPVPVVLQEENVKTLDRAVFERVDRLAAPRLVEYWEQDPCGGHARGERSAMQNVAPAPVMAEDSAADDDGVIVEAQFTVGEYEIVILSANDSTGLDKWLRKNEYKIPDGSEAVLRPYVEQGSKFFVAKVNSEKVTFKDGQVMLSPLRFHYNSEDFSLPVRLGLLNSSGKQDLIVHILAKDKRYEVANYKNVTVPTNIDVDDGVRKRFGEFYAALFDMTLEKNPAAVVTEYSWDASSCDPCPVPALRPDELATLGADVLNPTARKVSGSTNIGGAGVAGGKVANAASVVARMKGRFRACFNAGLETDPTMQGSATLTAKIGPGGEVLAVGGGASGGLSKIVPCLKAVVRGGAFSPPEGGSAVISIPITFVTQQQAPGIQAPATAAPVPLPSPPRFTSRNFVLTRLHVRYDKESMTEDLRFKEAEPIVGGREFNQGDDGLEKGARPGSINNFQARYAIRHRWEGPVTCSKPVFGKWGGPPSGRSGDSKPTAATDLAFAPRGNVQLASFLVGDVPELDLKGKGVAPRPAQAPKKDDGGGDATIEPKACGCDIVGRPSPAPWALLLLFGAAFAGRLTVRGDNR